MAKPKRVRVVLSLTVDSEAFAHLYSTKWYGYASEGEFRDAVRDHVMKLVEESPAAKRGAIEAVRRVES